jgi:hypothetical protein
VIDSDGRYRRSLLVLGLRRLEILAGKTMAKSYRRKSKRKDRTEEPSNGYGADGGSSHSVDNPANGHRLVEVRFKCAALGENGVPCDFERNTLLIEAIANGDFPQKGVSPTAPTRIVMGSLQRHRGKTRGSV